MNQDRPNGPVAAALIAGGLGCAAIGLLTTGGEGWGRIADLLRWSVPVGPLSGETTVGIAVFFISWIVLHFAWRGKNVNFARVTAITFVLIGIGLLGTCPVLFELLEAE